MKAALSLFLFIRELILQMSTANPLWGAPRIHGELLKLGIQIAQATAAKYMVRQRKPPSQTWRTFLARPAVGFDGFSRGIDFHKQVDQLTVCDITAEQVRLFLQDLEQTRGCSVTTRNQRLAVVHALARFIGENSPEHIEWCGTIRAIPFKKAMKREVTYLAKSEMDALLAAPDRRTAQGQRDYALLLFLYNTGARADEAVQLTTADLELANVPARDLSSVQIHGKGNKLRRCPLWPHTVSAIAALITDRAPHEHVFLNRCGQPITRFGIHTMVERYVQRLSAKMPALAHKASEPALGSSLFRVPDYAESCKTAIVRRPKNAGDSAAEERMTRHSFLVTRDC